MSAVPKHVIHCILMATALGLLSGCGGGGGDSSTPLPSAGIVAQKCSANNPYRFDADSATTIGSLYDEKTWLNDYMLKSYLWYTEIPDVNATAADYSNEGNVFGSLDAYFNALLSPALTASGKRKDQFSFITPTKDWNDLYTSSSSLSYGVEWYFGSSLPPRGIRILYGEPNSPAASAGLLRGDVLISVDGVSADDYTKAGVDILNEALFPSHNGAHSFVFARNGVNFTRTLDVEEVTKRPVLITKAIDTANGKVGYMLFNEHLAPAERQLIDGINQLKAANVSDLVLDLRYNGGGLLYIASELAYMIAGEARTNGKIFNKLRYNDKRTEDNAAPAAPFYSVSCILNNNFQCTSREALPTLNLGRVFVLTTNATCSASEALINSLEGIDVEVIRIGSTTCGKPYGMNAKDNCGISYLSIEFTEENNKGFGDYADGFAPACAVNDDLGAALGEETESMLSAALTRRSKGSCPSVAVKISVMSQGFIGRASVRENAFHLPVRR